MGSAGERRDSKGGQHARVEAQEKVRGPGGRVRPSAPQVSVTTPMMAGPLDATRHTNPDPPFRSPNFRPRMMCVLFRDFLTGFSKRKKQRRKEAMKCVGARSINHFPYLSVVVFRKRLLIFIALPIRPCTGIWRSSSGRRDSQREQR